MNTIENEAERLIARGNFIRQLAESEQVKNVEGINKFRKKVEVEIAFLKTVNLLLMNY